MNKGIACICGDVFFTSYITKLARDERMNEQIITMK